MSRHFTPVDVVELAAGSLEAVAGCVDLHEKTPYSWRHATKGRDAGDFPSTRIIRKLHRHFQAMDLPITLEHLTYGASEAELRDLGLIAPPADLEIAS